MNAKDKFVFGLLGVLIVGAFYFQFLTDELNKKIWENGIRHPPRKIKVQLLTDENNQIKVYPK